MVKSGSFFAVLLVGGSWTSEFESVAADSGRQLTLTTRTCAEALQMARAMRIGVLVTDIALPDGDGCDLFREIAARYRVRGVAVVSEPADEARCQAAGFHA